MAVGGREKRERVREGRREMRRGRVEEGAGGERRREEVEEGLRCDEDLCKHWVISGQTTEAYLPSKFLKSVSTTN